MASTSEGRRGLAWIMALSVLAMAIGQAQSDAGHFFAETPKHLPRIGRRGDLPPLATLLTEDARSSGKASQSVSEALGRLDVDRDGCIGVSELIRIPIVKAAILLQNPALLVPDVMAEAEENETRGTYSIDHRPEPRLLRFLQK